MEMPAAPRWVGRTALWFPPHVCRRCSRGPGSDLSEPPGGSQADLTWLSGSDLGAHSVYLKGRRHLVFAKIVGRRPQNSRPGLPQLRSCILGLRAAMGGVDGQASGHRGPLGWPASPAWRRQAGPTGNVGGEASSGEEGRVGCCSFRHELRSCSRRSPLRRQED